jgi:putative nucleotidyltransferase with HDIG domain
MMIRIIFGVIALFGLVIVALLYWYGSRSVIKPMRALLDGVNEAAAGNFEYRADIKKPAEVAELGNAINVMMNVMATYNAVSGALNSIANLQDMEKYVLEEMSELLQPEACAIVRFDVEGMLNIRVYKGYEEGQVDAHNAAQVDISGMEYMFGAQTVTALRRGETITLDVKKVKSLEKIVPGDDIEKVHLFPLIVLGNLDGVLLALTRSGVTFDENQLEGVKGIVGQMSVAIHRSELYERLYQSYAQTTRAIARAIDAKDPYNRGHSEGVAVMAVKIAQRMGLNVEEVRGVEIAAYLHDVGKIGVSESVLNKPAQLSEEERALIQQHPNIGTEILEPIDFPWPVIGAIESHHERFNGEGYPRGLAGEQIPLEARILAVADAYESMISDRPYRSALTLKEIIKEFARESGRQFDARVVSAFLDVLQKDQELEAELEQDTSGDLVKTQQEEVEGQEALPLLEEDVEAALGEVTDQSEVASLPKEQAPRLPAGRQAMTERHDVDDSVGDEANSSDTESDGEPEQGDVA